MHYAIVGFGCAGYHCAEEIRKIDPIGRITVFSDHEEAPYNPMLTTYYAAGRLLESGVYPFGSLAEIGARFKLDIRSGKKVRHIDGTKREIETEDGKRMRFDRILISSGASAWVPKIPGLNCENTYLMRTMEDAKKLKQHLESSCVKSAVVIGASMVGIKVVELLQEKGIETTLADLASGIFPLAAYPEVACEIERRVKNRGVRLMFQTSICSVRKMDGDLICRMTDNSEIRAQIVVLCIGTRANTGMIDPKEIQVNKGIIVNRNMETSCPGIYAAGDCCEGEDLLMRDTKIIGLWANAGYQGGTAGMNMAGKTGEFDGNILHNITHFMGMDFIGMGDNRAAGDVLTCGNLKEGMYIHAVLHEGRLTGVNILDNYRISGAVKNYFYRCLTEGVSMFSPVQRGILIKEGLRPSFLKRLEGEHI